MELQKQIMSELEILYKVSFVVVSYSPDLISLNYRSKHKIKSFLVKYFKSSNRSLIVVWFFFKFMGISVVVAILNEATFRQIPLEGFSSS